MRKQLIEATAFEVATQVRAVEDTIDTALEEIAELQSRMIRARAAAGVGVRTGHDALEQLGRALNALIAARGGIANCHSALVEAKRSVPGLRTVTGMGEGDECPKTAVAQPPLRVVA